MICTTALLSFLSEGFGLGGGGPRLPLCLAAPLSGKQQLGAGRLVELLRADHDREDVVHDLVLIPCKDSDGKRCICVAT